MKLHNAYIFISSTFTDMVSERDLVMYEIYPELEKWGKSHGININIVDLRWGITEEQAKALHHTIKLCLMKVNEADPLFISFLGDRYGWPPNKEDFNSEIIGKNIDDYVGKDISATELEILQALYNTFYDGSKKDCLFFIRDMSKLSIPDEMKPIFKDERCDAAKSLQERIKTNYKDCTFTYQVEFDTSRKIRYSNNREYYPLYNFVYNDKHLKDFIIDKVKESLMNKYHIDENIEYEVNSNDYIIAKYKESVPVPSIDNALIEMIENTKYSNQGLFLCSGNGKTSAIARLIYNNDKYDYIVRFMGFDVDSNDYYLVAKSIALEIKKRYKLETTPEDKYEEYIQYINDFFKNYQSKKKLVIIIDGINEVRSLYNDWRLFFDCLKVDKLIFTSTTIPSNLVRESDVVINSLSYDEIKDILMFILKKEAKSLSPNMLDKIIKSTNNELVKANYILYYLKRFSVHEKLEETINYLIKLPTFNVIHQTYYELMKVQSERCDPGMLDTIMIILSLSPNGCDLYMLKKLIRHFYGLTNDTINNLDDSIQFVKNFVNEFLLDVNDRLYIVDPWLKDYITRTLYENNIVQLFNTVTIIFLEYLEAIEKGDFKNISDKDFINIEYALGFMPKNTIAAAPISFYIHPEFLYQCLSKRGRKNTNSMYRKIIQKSRGIDYIEDGFILDEKFKALKIQEDSSFKTLLRDMQDTFFSKVYRFLLNLDEDDIKDKDLFFAKYIDTFKDHAFQDTFMTENFEYLLKLYRRKQHA